MSTIKTTVVGSPATEYKDERGLPTCARLMSVRLSGVRQDLFSFIVNTPDKYKGEKVYICIYQKTPIPTKIWEYHFGVDKDFIIADNERFVAFKPRRDLLQEYAGIDDIATICHYNFLNGGDCYIWWATKEEFKHLLN